MEAVCAVPDQREQVVPGIDAGVLETSFDFNQAISDIDILKKPSTPKSVGTLLNDDFKGFANAFNTTQTPTTPTIFEAVRNAHNDQFSEFSTIAMVTGAPARSEVRPIVPSAPFSEIRVALSPPMELDEERSTSASPTEKPMPYAMHPAEMAAGSPADPGYDSPVQLEKPEQMVTTTRSGRRVKMRVVIDASPEPEDSAVTRRRAVATDKATAAAGGGRPVRNSAVVRAQRGAAQARASPLPIANDGVLPPDHRPARGRGRQQQLMRMTKEQRDAEAAARLEKNRVAARECRIRRKEHLSVLEDQVNEYEARDFEQQQLIASLRAEVAALTAELASRG